MSKNSNFFNLLLRKYSYGGTIQSLVKGVILAEGKRKEIRILNINIMHTSASLVIQENTDPDVLHDLKNFFHKWSRGKFISRVYSYFKKILR